MSPAGHDFVSLKDFTCVHWNNDFVVYATVFDQTLSAWNMVNFNFGDWSQAATASQFYMQNSPTHGGVAPQLFYFNPKNEWILVYQWGATFATSSDPTNPQLWSTLEIAPHRRPLGRDRLLGHLRHPELLPVLRR